MRTRPGRLERPTYRFEACRSIQLSYGRKTFSHCPSLASDPAAYSRGTGFEPAASWFEAKRSIRLSYGRVAAIQILGPLHKRGTQVPLLSVVRHPEYETMRNRVAQEKSLAFPSSCRSLRLSCGRKILTRRHETGKPTNEPVLPANMRAQH